MIRIILTIMVILVLIYVALRIIKTLFKVALIIIIIAVAFAFISGTNIIDDYKELTQWEERYIVLGSEPLAGILQTRTGVELLSDEHEYDKNKTIYIVPKDMEMFDIEFEGMHIGYDKVLLYLDSGLDFYAEDITSLMGLPPAAKDTMIIDFNSRGITESNFGSYLFSEMIKSMESEGISLIKAAEVDNSAFIIQKLKGDSLWVYSKH